MRITPRPIAAAMFCLIFVARAKAQVDEATSYSVRHWGVEEGMPHNSVEGVVQTDDGFLWVATDGGLVRFDGIQFVPLAASPVVDSKDSTIHAIIETDAKTMLAVNAKSELLRIEGSGTKRISTRSRIDSPQSVQNLFRESDGVYWIAFVDNEVWRCSPDKIERFPLGVRHSAQTVTFAKTSEGGVYICRGLGVESYRSGSLQVLPGLDSPQAAICASKGGGAWLAEGGRLSKLYADKKVPMGGQSWPANFIPDVLTESRDGTVWLGLANYGLVHWTQQGATVVQSFRSRINALFEDDAGDLWVATAGGGLNRLHANRFELLANAVNLPDSSASSVCEDSLGDMWFAEHAALARRHNGVLENLSSVRRLAAGSLLDLPRSERARLDRIRPKFV